MKNKKFIEIEIQVQLEKVKNLLKFLKKNAKFIGKEHQIDSYFTPAHRNFLAKKPIKEWLRLRNSSGKYSVNYKNWYYDKNGKSDYCDEFETEIKDIEALEKMFKALNVKPLTVVDKTREIYRYKDFEIAIDSVKNLGDYVEMEFKGKSNGKTAKDINEEMVKFLKDRNCGKIYRNYGGYPFKLLFPGQEKIEEY